MSQSAGQVFGTLALVALAYCGLIYSTGWRASLGETNFQNNLIRADAFLHGPPKEIVIVGTSVSGRLLPQYFPDGGKTVANLGLDGCTLITGLEILRICAHYPRTLLLECTMTRLDPLGNDVETLKSIEGPAFWLAGWLPLFKPTWRPTSVLYTGIKLCREGMLKDGESDGSYASLPPQDVQPLVTRPGPRTWEEGTLAAVAELRAAGVSCIALRLPIGAESSAADSRPADLGDTMAESFDLPVIDTVQEIRRRGIQVRFTDGVHLQSTSARALSQIVWAALEEQPGPKALSPSE